MYSRKRSNGFGKSFLVYCILLGFGLFLFFTNDRTSFLNRYTQYSLSFWQSLLANVSLRVNESFNALGNLTDLKKELEEAQQRIRFLEEAQAGSLLLQAEIARLKEQLGFYKKISYRSIPAQVIAKEPFGTTGMFTVNKGERDGVAVKYPVIAYQEGRHALVGEIYSTSPISACVIPLANKKSNISARLLNCRYEGLVRGLGLNKNLLRMDYIPKEALKSLKIGEAVVTSGLSGPHFAGLLIGNIKKVENNEHVPYITAYVEPAIQNLRLEYVFVQKPQIKSILDCEKEKSQEKS